MYNIVVNLVISLIGIVGLIGIIEIIIITIEQFFKYLENNDEEKPLSELPPLPPPKPTYNLKEQKIASAVAYAIAKAAKGKSKKKWVGKPGWCELCHLRPASVNLILTAGTHRECRSCWDD